MALMTDEDDPRASDVVVRARLLDRRGSSLAAFLILAVVLLGASFGSHLRGDFVWTMFTWWREPGAFPG